MEYSQAQTEPSTKVNGTTMSKLVKVNISPQAERFTTEIGLTAKGTDKVYANIQTVLSTMVNGKATIGMVKANTLKKMAPKLLEPSLRTSCKTGT